MTFIDALNHSPEAKTLIESIEDCLSSWDGRRRYASELEAMVAELFEMTGYRYQLD